MISLPLNWPQEAWFRGWNLADVGQTHMIQPSTDNLLTVISLAGRDITVEHAAAALSSVVARHDALRSFIVGGFSTAAIQRIQTQPAKAGIAWLMPQIKIVDLEHWTNAIRVACSHDFSLGSEYPFITVLGILRNRVVSIAAVVDHSACDGWGIAALEAEIRDQLVLEHPSSKAMRQPLQPRDVLAYQKSEAGTQKAASALAYWKTVFERFASSPRDYPYAVPIRTSRAAVNMLTIQSVDIARVVRAIAVSAGASVSAVYLAILANVILQELDVPSLILHNTVLNREMSGADRSVSKMFMRSPVLASRRSQMRAYDLRDITYQLTLSHTVAMLPPKLAETVSYALLDEGFSLERLSPSFNFWSSSIRVGNSSPEPETGLSQCLQTLVQVGPIRSTYTTSTPSAGGRPLKLTVAHSNEDTRIIIAVRSDTSLRHLDGLPTKVAEELLRLARNCGVDPALLSGGSIQ